jgi:manganese/iron transport system permease protein
LLLRRLFVLVSFDPSGARAMGLPVVALDVLLLALTALTVVISFKAVGNILVIALLITPPATARLLTDRLLPTMALAAAIGACAGVIGAYFGYRLDASAGGVIVLLATLTFFAAWLAAPRHGILSEALTRRRSALRDEQPEAVAQVILASSGIQAPHEH